MTAGERDLLIQLFLQISVSLWFVKMCTIYKAAWMVITCQRNEFVRNLSYVETREKWFKINPVMKGEDQRLALKKARKEDLSALNP